MARNSDLNQSPMHLFHRAGQCAEELFQAEIPDLTPRQLAVLVAVADNEGLNQTRLTEITGVDRSTLSDVVHRMQRNGLLQRRRTREDARAYSVNLTDQGRRALAAASPIARRVDERVLAALSPKQRGAFLAALASIVDAVQRTSSGKPTARRTD